MKDHPGNQRTFELHSTGGTQAPGYPITLSAHKDQVKADWLKEIRQYTSDVIALAEHAADDLQLTDTGELEKQGTEPLAADMSRRYSSSRISASSKLVEGSFFRSIFSYYSFSKLMFLF